jgi:hypothetical protein
LRFSTWAETHGESARDEEDSMRFLKLFVLLVIVTALAPPAHAIDAFILIPGVPGESARVGRDGWSDVESETLRIAPALAEKGKSVEIRCSATIRGFLGAGVAAAVGLVGSPLGGDVVVEMEHPVTPGVISRAALGGAVIESIERSFPLLSHDLTIRFSSIELTTRKQKADGTLEAPQVGRFDCTVP